MPRGHKTHIFILFLALFLTGCASTFTVTEASALHVIEADSSKARLATPSDGFRVLAHASPAALEGESIMLRAQTSQDAFLLVCEENYDRPLYPSLAFPKEWPENPARQWDLRLPWVLTRGPSFQIHVFAFRSFGEFDGLRYGMQKGDITCTSLLRDSDAVFDQGMIAKTTVQVRVQR